MAVFTNQATLSYNNLVTTSNVVQGDLVKTLSVTKTPIEDGYQAEDIVSYAVSLVNAGETDFNGLTLSDNLGAYAYNTQTLVPLSYQVGSVTCFINGVRQTAPTITSTSPLTITGIGVPANGNTLLIYSARVNQFAPLEDEATIENTVSVSGGGLGDALTATASMATETAPKLSLIKAVNPVSIVENEPVTFTFTIQNNGTAVATAQDLLVIADTFNPVLAITSVTLNGTALAQTTDYTYDAASGQFSTVAGAITVPAATYARDETTGAWTITPGTSTLTVTGTM